MIEVFAARCQNTFHQLDERWNHYYWQSYICEHDKKNGKLQKEQTYFGKQKKPNQRQTIAQNTTLKPIRRFMPVCYHLKKNI